MRLQGQERLCHELASVCLRLFRVYQEGQAKLPHLLAQLPTQRWLASKRANNAHQQRNLQEIDTCREQLPVYSSQIRR